MRPHAVVEEEEQAIDVPLQPPKRPANAWARFLSHAFWEQKGEIPGKEIRAWASSQWKAMGDVERAPFVHAYNEEKAEYDREKAEYDRALESRPHTPTMPTRPMTAFKISLREFREANPEIKYNDAQRAVSKKWKVMADEEKNMYHAKVASAKEDYEKQLDEYLDWLKTTVKTESELRLALLFAHDD